MVQYNKFLREIAPNFEGGCVMQSCGPGLSAGGDSGDNDECLCGFEKMMAELDRRLAVRARRFLQSGLAFTNAVSKRGRTVATRGTKLGARVCAPTNAQGAGAHWRGEQVRAEEAGRGGQGILLVRGRSLREAAS